MDKLRKDIVNMPTNDQLTYLFEEAKHRGLLAEEIDQDQGLHMLQLFKQHSRLAQAYHASSLQR